MNFNFYFNYDLILENLTKDIYVDYLCEDYFDFNGGKFYFHKPYVGQIGHKTVHFSVPTMMTIDYKYVITEELYNRTKHNKEFNQKIDELLK